MSCGSPLTGPRIVALSDGHSDSTRRTPSVGYVGGGEPARRFQQAAADLGVELVVYSPGPTLPSGASQEASHHLVAVTLDELVTRSSLITVGHGCDQHTYSAVVEAAGPSLRPNPSTIRFSHEPLAARYHLQGYGFDVAEFEEIDAGDTAAVTRFARHHGWPVRLRAARWGTTAPTVHLVRPYSALDHVWGDTSGQLWLLDGCEPLVAHLTVVLARRPSGQQFVCAPVATGAQVCQPCQPLPLATSIVDQAIATATSIVDTLEATGIVTVNFLHSHDGRLLVDDLSYGPEPHPLRSAPTDHSVWLLHLRAILDLPIDSVTTADSGRSTRAIVPPPVGLPPEDRATLSR